MTSTITTAPDTQYTDEDLTLVRNSLAPHDGLSFLELTFLDLVAPLKKDFIKEELLDKTLLLLNAKNKLSRLQKGYKKLEENTVPPSSIRFKLELTSPEPEVVASNQFCTLKDEFDTGLASFQKQATNIFLKTKMMNMDAAKQQLQSKFYESINALLELVAEYEMNLMPNESDIEKIADAGGHKLFVGQAWKNLLTAATAPINALDPNTNEQATYFTNMAHYLKTNPTIVKQEVIKPYATLQTGNLRSMFSTSDQIDDVNSVVDTLEHFILTITDSMTVLTHNTYSRHQCEREISNKLKASIKARKTETTTTTVNDIIENEDTYSAPQLENYIDGRVNQAVKKATNP